MVTRLATFAAQIWVARILTQSEMGLFAIALQVQSYANMAQQIGVREVLISRQKRYHLWQNATFWIAQTMGIISSLLIVAAAPFAAWIYSTDPTIPWWHSPLLPMLLIFAIAQPLYNLTLVQEAKVQIDHRFKYAAMGTAAQGIAQPVSQIALAMMKFGAFALVWPRLIVGVVRCLIYSKAAPLHIRRDPQVRVWKYVLIPGAMVLLVNLAYNIPQSIPVLVLGKLGGPDSEVGKKAAGIFYFAFTLSIQTLVMLSQQIDAVLFPTLGKMGDDPKRQRGALLRAGHALAAVLAPVCAMQIVAARPVILLFFSPKDNPLKWEPAILPFQIMSVGMLVAGAFAPAHSLLQAQGRFAAKLWIGVAWGAVSAIVSVVGIWLAPDEYKVAAGAVGLSIGLGGYMAHYCVAATRPLGGGAGDAARILTLPTLIAAGAGAAAFFAARLLPSSVGSLRMTYFVQAAVMGCVGGVAYLIGLRVLAPGVWNDLKLAAHPILRRFARFMPGKTTGAGA
jgi:PST family polysaccharide transporter